MAQQDPLKTRPTVAPDKARQGRSGRQVLTVLISALVLVMVVWGLVEIYGWMIRPTQQEQVGDPATVEEGTTGGITLPSPAEQ